MNPIDLEPVDGVVGRAHRPTRTRLGDNFSGCLVGAGDDDYDALRVVFNGAIDRRPAIIARPGDVGDVVAVVTHAREHELALAVRGGGHAITGHAVSDGGVCLDMRSLKAIHVDPAARRVRVQAGVTWGELDRATQRAGLVVPGGRAPSTGVAGVTLGSGSGWLERKHGLTADSLRSADVVTADGRLTAASPQADSELFWGLCGGGGNLGVVTELEFALHPIAPQVLAGMLLYPGEQATAIIEGFRALMAKAPDELGAMLALLSAPVADWVPERLRGRPAVAVLGGWLETPERGEGALERLRGLGSVAVDAVRPMSYLELQQLLDPGPAGALRHRWTADCLSELPEPAIDAVLAHAFAAPSPLSQTLLMPGGGALRHGGHDTLLAARHAPWSVHAIAMWSEPAHDDRQRAWVDALRTQLAPWITGRSYLNFADDDPEALRVALGPDPHARLAELKGRYDPTNLFRHNPNVAPAASATS